VRLFRREPGPPAEVIARAALQRGERPLASAEARDGSWLVGTRTRLVLVRPGGVVDLPWEQVEAAGWDRDSGRLQISEVGEYGRERASYSFDVEEPRLLLQLVRERVTNSVVLQRRVVVRGRQGFSVIARRNPAGGELTWMHEYDPGVEPDDPEVARLAEAALREAQAEVGERPTD
jgi:hypothetical protein